MPKGVLYVQNNSTTPGRNGILAYRRGQDGSLTMLPGSPFLTGGTGFTDTSFPLGPFDADYIFEADPVGGVLFAANGGTNTVAALRFAPDGSLAPVPGSPFAVKGGTPDAFALRDRTLIVVDNAGDPTQSAGQAGYETFRLDTRDRLKAASDKLFPIPNAESPSQALAMPGMPYVLTDQFLGGTISSWFLDLHGRLSLIQTVSAPQEPGETKAPVPLGLVAHPTLPVVYAGLANVNRVGIFSMGRDGHLAFLRSVADSGGAPCWFRIDARARRMYVSNTGDNSVSVFDLRRPDQPVELQRLALRQATGGTFQISLDPEEHFLYALEEENSAASAGRSNQVHVMRISPAGLVAEMDSSPVKLPVPAGQVPQGLFVN